MTFEVKVGRGDSAFLSCSPRGLRAASASTLPQCSECGNHFIVLRESLALVF